MIQTPTPDRWTGTPTPAHAAFETHRFAARVVDVWELDLGKRESADDRALLTEAEQAKGDRIIIPRKATQSLRARAELRRVLGHYLGMPAGEVRFVYGEHDKPDLDPALQPSARREGPGFELLCTLASTSSDLATATLSFNLSHSEAAGLVAVILDLRAHELGVDVEHARCDRNLIGIAETFFAADEFAYFRRVAAAEQCPAFYRAWTRKEAYLKALGTGMSFPSNRFSITFGRDEAPRVMRTEREGDDPSRWQLVDLPCAGDYAGAACWDGAAFPVRRYWGPTSLPTRAT
ncbi:4'-phosphopantetheinyl transferase [Plesiocystis pacifica SIR-1]|uniref:4'-phosphopantetheinyl transferase n=1 Tax=Plesiocystis pacifica SIR-1 TaxID=391625 RepID=A6GDR2_9BACT|nr:4'-phosphopantetheinyl transferase superfamily protein [Plesiocystis pacifica]EDM75951.1 4'-phosphopantetheinyl transferase [Plesiocystis pacifica SIR-1]